MGLLLAAPALAGCVDSIAGFQSGSATSEDVGGEGFHVRRTDFYHSYRANEETFTDEFKWKAPEGAAEVEVRHSIAAGHEVVSLKDASGATVWSHRFDADSPQGVFHPGTGEPGTWTIVIERWQATGNFDLHVWRRVPQGDGDAA